MPSQTALLFNPGYTIPKTSVFEREKRALIMASATPNESPHRAKWPKHPNNKAFDKSGIYSKSPKVADTVIEAEKRLERYPFNARPLEYDYRYSKCPEGPFLAALTSGV